MPLEISAKLAALSTRPGLIYAATVVVLMVILQLSRRFGALFLLITFPVTLAHEFTHLVLGFITGGQPSGLRIFPRRSARGYVLGSVTCNNVRWYNGLFIGLAPLLLLPVAFVVLVWRVRTQPAATLDEAAWALAIAVLATASLPSTQDLRVALTSSWLLLALLAGGVALGFSGW
jgi:hypothetical protein